MDTGDQSAFAATVNAGRDPSPEHIENLAAAVEEQASVLRTAGDTSCSLHRPRLARALEGQAGKAQIVVHDANVGLWDTHADLYKQSGRALRNALGELYGLKHDLRLLIAEKEPHYNAALQRGDAPGAQGILTDTLAEADGMVADRGERAKDYVQAVNFTAPLPERPVTDGQDQQDRDAGDKKKKPPRDKWSETKGSTGDADGSAPNGAAPGPADDGNGERNKWAPAGPGQPSVPNGAALGAADDGNGERNKWTPAEPGPTPLAQRGMPFPGPANGAAGGSSLGSSLRPSSLPSASMGSAPGAGAATSPASSMPRVPSPPPAPSPSTASPMANAGSSFQSGLASGMGASGGMAPALSAQQPLQPFVSQQPSVAVPGSGVGAAGVPAAGAGFSGIGDAGAASGHAAAGGSAASPGASGASAIMPPAAAVGASQPLAPYSAPGAGAAGAATAPATGGSGQVPSSGGSGSSAGAAGAQPVLAGNPGSSAAMSALAGSSTEVNPDLLMARRVLAELTRGGTDYDSYDMLVRWAVSVLNSPYGRQIVVANDFGNGGYLPRLVFLPTTVRLAVNDPALPVDWAEQWMGCRFPSKILADHFDRLGKTVPGLSVSAIVSTEDTPESPPDCGGDFEVIRYKDALNLASEAPKLDGAHRHRLAVIDPGLAQRVEDLDRGGTGSLWAAATLTDVLFGEARKPDDIGQPLVTDDEYSVLAAVNTDTANPEVWAAYDRALEKPDRMAAVWPQGHGPLDHDGSDFARDRIRVYRHFFRMGRMIELVQCWKARPPRLAEVAYCGIAAGFGPLVATTITRMEQHLRGGGRLGGNQ